MFEEDDLFSDLSLDTNATPSPISEEEKEEITLPEDEDEGVVPSNKEKPITNLEFLSRMLHSSLRGYLKEYRKWLRDKFSEPLLTLFLDIASKLEDSDVSPEVLEAVLPDLGVDDLRKSIIVSNYRLIMEDDSRTLCKVTYDKFREIIYQAYFKSVNTGNAVETLEKIQNSDFFLPPFGMIQNDNFQQLKFGEFDMSTIMEDLGSPLYSHFQDINNISPIKGYIPSQVTMVSGQIGPRNLINFWNLDLRNQKLHTIREVQRLDMRLNSSSEDIVYIY